MMAGTAVVILGANRIPTTVMLPMTIPGQCQSPGDSRAAQIGIPLGRPRKLGTCPSRINVPTPLRYPDTT
jgi:hypothetical protein